MRRVEFLGTPGSGKSTLAAELAGSLPGALSLSKTRCGWPLVNGAVTGSPDSWPDLPALPPAVSGAALTGDPRIDSPPSPAS